MLFVQVRPPHLVASDPILFTIDMASEYQHVFKLGQASYVLTAVTYTKLRVECSAAGRPTYLDGMPRPLLPTSTSFSTSLIILRSRMKRVTQSAFESLPLSHRHSRLRARKSVHQRIRRNQ